MRHHEDVFQPFFLSNRVSDPSSKTHCEVSHSILSVLQKLLLKEILSGVLDKVVLKVWARLDQRLWFSLCYRILFINHFGNSLYKKCHLIIHPALFIVQFTSVCDDLIPVGLLHWSKESIHTATFYSSLHS